MADNESEKVDEVQQEKTDQGGEDTGKDESDIAVLEEGQEEGKKAEDQEIEIVREGSHPSKSDPNTPAWVQPRINKLSAQKNQAKQEADTANSRANVAEERNRILELALDQAKGQKTVSQPNPDDFDSGISDPEFIRKNNEYTQSLIQNEVARQVEVSTQSLTASTQQRNREQDFEAKQDNHVGRASKLKVKDYNETQEKLVDTMGLDVVKQIINNFDDSEIMIYGLGKDPAEAARLSSLFQTNPILGVAELGKFRAELKVKPKSNNPVADPDEEIEGASGSPNGHFAKQLEKLRERATKREPGIMAKILELKKKAVEKGITLE